MRGGNLAQNRKGERVSGEKQRRNRRLRRFSDPWLSGQWTSSPADPAASDAVPSSLAGSHWAVASPACRPRDLHRAHDLPSPRLAEAALPRGGGGGRRHQGGCMASGSGWCCFRPAALMIPQQASRLQIQCNMGPSQPRCSSTQDTALLPLAVGEGATDPQPALHLPEVGTSDAPLPKGHRWMLSCLQAVPQRVSCWAGSCAERTHGHHLARGACATPA